MNQAARSVSIADGRMAIEGVAGGFVQDSGRPLRLEAEDLVPVSGHDWREGALHEGRRIEARARPVEASLRRAGFEGQAHQLALTIRPFPTESASAPMLRLGLAAGAQGGLDDGFIAELFLPQTLFAALQADLAAGRAGRLSLTATTNLWLHEAEREAAPGRPPTFHFGIEADGLRSASAHGRVQQLEWRATPLAPEAPAEAAGTDPAFDDEATEDPVAEQLRRINWSLKQLLIVLAFLMLIVALK